MSHCEVSRIGFNDISRRYALDHDARLTRYRALLESVLYTFVQPKGAMRATQLPHTVGMEGIVSFSTHVIPAPTVSPLNPDYQTEIERIAAVLNRLHPTAVTVKRFGTLAGFAEVMQELVETTEPFALAA